MSDTSAIDAASRRLALAMDALEAAIERRHEVEPRANGPSPSSFTRWGATARGWRRTSIPTAARVRALETTNREIARRLDVAIESVRGVLEANDR